MGNKELNENITNKIINKIRAAGINVEISAEKIQELLELRKDISKMTVDIQEFEEKRKEIENIRNYIPIISDENKALVREQEFIDFQTSLIACKKFIDDLPGKKLPNIKFTAQNNKGDVVNIELIVQKKDENLVLTTPSDTLIYNFDTKVVESNFIFEAFKDYNATNNCCDILVKAINDNLGKQLGEQRRKLKKLMQENAVLSGKALNELSEEETKELKENLKELDYEQVEGILVHKDKKIALTPEDYVKEVKNAKLLADHNHTVYLLPENFAFRKKNEFGQNESYSTPDTLTDEEFVELKTTKNNLGIRFGEAVEQANNVLIRIQNDISLHNVRRRLQNKINNLPKEKNINVKDGKLFLYFEKKGKYIEAEIKQGKINILPAVSELADFSVVPPTSNIISQAEELSSSIPEVNSMTANGNVIGVAYNNNIILHPDYLSSNAAVHEYTHLWDAYTQKTNPELWNKGLKIFKNTKYWNEVISDSNYQDIKDDENLVLSEIHSRICGDIAEKVLNRIAELDGEQVKLDAIDWNKEVWNYISDEMELTKKYRAKMFNKGISKTDLQDFLSTPLKDLIQERNISINNVNKTISGNLKFENADPENSWTDEDSFVVQLFETNNNYELEKLLDPDFDVENDSISFHFRRTLGKEDSIDWENHVSASHNSGFIDFSDTSNELAKQIHEKCIEAADDFCQKKYNMTLDSVMKKIRNDQLVELWHELEDIPFDKDDTGISVLSEDWKFKFEDKEFTFSKGTEQETIWRWFDERYSKGISYLMYGETEKEHVYLFPKDFVKNTLDYPDNNLSYLGTYIFPDSGECQVVSGSLVKLNEFAESLGYELHPDFIYEKEDLVLSQARPLDTEQYKNMVESIDKYSQKYMRENFTWMSATQLKYWLKENQNIEITNEQSSALIQSLYGNNRDIGLVDNKLFYWQAESATDEYHPTTLEELCNMQLEVEMNMHQDNMNNYLSEITEIAKENNFKSILDRIEKNNLQTAINKQNQNKKDTNTEFLPIENKSSIVIEDAEWGDVFVVKHGQYNGKSGWYYGLFNQHMEISNVEDNLSFYTDEHMYETLQKPYDDINPIDVARQILIDHQDYGWQRTVSEKDFSEQWLNQTGTELSSKDQQEYLNKLDELLNEKFIEKNKPSLEPLNYHRYVNTHLPSLATQFNSEQIAELISYNEQAGDKMLYDKENDKLYRLNEYDVPNYEKTHNTDLLNESDLLEMLSFSASEAEDGNNGRTEDDPMIKVNNEAGNFFNEKIKEINVANITNSFLKSLTDSRKDDFYSPDAEHECRFYCDFDPSVLGFNDSLESEDTTYRIGMVFNKGQECVDYFIDRINNSSTIDYDVQVELGENFKKAFSLAEDHVRRWFIEKNPETFPIIVDYAFPETQHGLISYEEPRWSFTDKEQILGIIKNNSPDVYDELMEIIKEYPDETFNFDLGKSLVYSDNWIVGSGTRDFSKESLEDKLDDIYKFRYWNNYDDNHNDINDFDEPIELVLKDKELVSKLNEMIKSHVQENIENWNVYKEKRIDSVINELRGEQLHIYDRGKEDSLRLQTLTLSSALEEKLDLSNGGYTIDGKSYQSNFWLEADYEIKEGNVKFTYKELPVIKVHEYIDINQHEEEKSVRELSYYVSEELHKKISYEFDAKMVEETILPDLGLTRQDFIQFENLFKDTITSEADYDGNLWRVFSQVHRKWGNDRTPEWKIENTISRMLYDSIENNLYKTYELGEDDGRILRCECCDDIASRIVSGEIKDWETIQKKAEVFCKDWVMNNELKNDISVNTIFGHSVPESNEIGAEIKKHTFIYKIDNEIAKSLGLELESSDNPDVKYSYEVRGTYSEQYNSDKLRFDNPEFDFISLATDYSEDKEFGNPLDEKTAIYPLADYKSTFGEKTVTTIRDSLSKKAAELTGSLRIYKLSKGNEEVHFNAEELEPAQVEDIQLFFAKEAKSNKYPSTKLVNEIIRMTDEDDAGLYVDPAGRICMNVDDGIKTFNSAVELGETILKFFDNQIENGSLEPFELMEETHFSDELQQLVNEIQTENTYKPIIVENGKRYELAVNNTEKDRKDIVDALENIVAENENKPVEQIFKEEFLSRFNKGERTPYKMHKMTLEIIKNWQENEPVKGNALIDYFVDYKKKNNLKDEDVFNHFFEKELKLIPPKKIHELNNKKQVKSNDKDDPERDR